MKTNLIGKLVMFVLTSLLFISCSNEDNVVASDDQGVNTFAARNAPDFSAVLTSLYGSSYTFGAVNAVTNANFTYKVTEVVTSGSSKPAGYIIETPDEDYYYDVKLSKGTVSEFTTTSATPVAIYDLKKDPSFNAITFNPYTKPNVAANRFWGWDWTGPSNNLYKDKDNPGHCYRKQTKTYYVFWLSVNIVEQQGKENHVPGECNDSAIDDPV